VGIESALATACDTLELRGAVGDAIRYALLGEGKRLRGLLVICGYQACGGRGDASGLAAAVEIVHAYSLVHDDLPCMDNDVVRRGRATVHRAFGVGVATAAGIAMVPMAARAAWRAAQSMGLPASESGAIVHDLMRASGASGMIGGQLLDLEAEGMELTLSDIEMVHRAKTGALIEASVRIGGRAAGATLAQGAALGAFGAAVGLAFQIADDVLDVTGTTATLGKTAGRDAELRKSTHPAILGVDGARARAEALSSRACAALSEAGLLTAPLSMLARYVVERPS